MNASSFANNVSTIIVSFAVIVSLKSHQMRARQVSNASRYSYEYRDAMEVVSQEMGHFRPEITEVYLR